VCWYHNAAIKGFTVKEFEFPVLDVPNMSVDDVLDLYDQNISSNTRVVVFPHIDNVVGLVHPVKELAQLARDRGVEIVTVDGAQSVGMLELNVSDMGVDLYCTSPHKWIQSPKGLGLMYMSQQLQDAVPPMWVTWGQARWRGSIRRFEDYGTRNLPELLALGDAIDFQLSLGTRAKLERYRYLWEFFRAATRESDHVLWRSPESWSMSASLFAVEVKDKVSTEVSDSMYRAHGYVFRPFRTQGLNTLRISPNVYNTEEEIERFFALTARL
ncbi:MAG: aminotransferase class V-fold PLP-dependent enzyme, partial [Gemmatimonadota bacterium]